MLLLKTVNEISPGPGPEPTFLRPSILRPLATDIATQSIPFILVSILKQHCHTLQSAPLINALT